MTKHRVFIYGSCVSRDTFEHFDPEQFELVQYVARQSALSAYTRPVTLVEPPRLESPFQQRMVSGDYKSSLQNLIPDLGMQTDLVLVDLADERLGAYVLPDGSVVTRTIELIESGAENDLPQGTQLLPFGSELHLQYWTSGITSVGKLLRQYMPHAAIVLLDIPWADQSKDGTPTPLSFGVGAETANPLYKAYAQTASRALNARTVTLESSQVRSDPEHPWGDAPFHYAADVYQRIAQLICRDEGSGPTSSHQSVSSAAQSHSTSPPEMGHAASDSLPPESTGLPNLFIAGTQHAGAEWLASQLDLHPEVGIAKGKGRGFFNRPTRIENEAAASEYRQAIRSAGPARWLGDCSPDYFWHSEGGPFGPRKTDTAAQLRRNAAPDAQVFLCLREPVSRAIAAFWHYYSLGKMDAASGIFRASKNLGIIDMGFYKRHYEHWVDNLGEDRVHVLLYDDLVDDPKGQIESTLNQLQLEGDEAYWSSVDAGPVVKPKAWIRPIQARNPISEQEIAALFELYRPEIDFVESIFGRELAGWNDLETIIRRNSVVQKGSTQMRV